MIMTTRRSVLGGMAVVGIGAAAPAMAAGTVQAGGVIPLWPDLPPGAPGQMPQRHVNERSSDPNFHDRWITGVAQPSLSLRRPAYPNGSAVLLVPGGGYGFIAWDNEGEEQARWLTARGVTCFILSYRLPGEGWADRSLVPLQDAQRALRLIRARAGEFGVDAGRVAVLGFSAGGHLAGSLATRFAEAVYAPVDEIDRQSARPDLAGLIYPVVSLHETFTHEGSRDNLLGPDSTADQRRHASVEARVTAETPPIFLAHTSDDGVVPIDNSLALYRALLAAGRTGELHAFDQGGHGFGVRLPKEAPASAWPQLFHAYGARLGVFKA
jgi:acetyl esterase/lipase